MLINNAHFCLLLTGSILLSSPVEGKKKSIKSRTLAKVKTTTKTTSNNNNNDNDHSITIFPNEFQSFKKNDPILKRLITKYINHIYPEGRKEEESLDPILKNVVGEKAFRIDKQTKVWSPVNCADLGMDLRQIDVIHEGRRNSVFKVSDKKSKKVFVWKIFENPDEYTYEISFLSVANHPNIIKPICIQQHKDTGMAGLVLEYASGGKSSTFAEENGHDRKKMIKLAAQMYDILKYMHWLGFVHADFKPENVMIDENGDAKAIDFGFTIQLPFYKYYRGTPNTLAPEVAKVIPGPIWENIDWWALGSSIAQIVGLTMMEKSTHDKRKGARLHKWAPIRISGSRGYQFGELPSSFDQDLRQLMYFLMNPKPTQRMFNTPIQLEFLESLPFWHHIDFNKIGYDWKRVQKRSKD